jgi:PAS domain-containing protein
VALLVTGCSLIATLIWLRSRAGTALREAIDRNKLLDDVLTALPDEAYRFDAGGRLSYANRQGFRALVRRREE